MPRAAHLEHCERESCNCNFQANAVTTIFMIYLFSIIAVAFTMIGAGLAARFGGVNKRVLSRTLAFSAGVLLSAAFLDIFPEAWRISPMHAAGGCLAALLALFALENFTVMNSCSEYLEDCKVGEHALGAFALAAMTAHSVLDGFNIAVGFKAGTLAGFNISLGIILHKLADGIALVSLLLHSGRTAKQAISLSLCLALATPLGALIVQPLFLSVEPWAEALLLGVSGGSFLYIAMADILPGLHKTYDRLTPAFYALGYAAVIAITALGQGIAARG